MGTQWSNEKPGTLVKHLLNVDLNKASFTISDDLICINNVPVNKFIRHSFEAFQKQVKHNKIRIQEIDVQLKDSSLTRESKNLLEQEKAQLQDAIHFWISKQDPDKSAVPESVRAIAALNKNIQKFKSISQKRSRADTFETVKMLKKIKLQMLEIGKDIHKINKIPIADMHDLEETAKIIGMLVFDVYDYIVNTTLDPTLLSKARAFSQSNTREIAYLSFINHSLGLNFEPVPVVFKKGPRKDEQFYASLPIRRGDNPAVLDYGDIILTQLSLSPINLNMRKRVLFESNTEILVDKKARDAIFDAIETNKKVTLTQIIKIFIALTSQMDNNVEIGKKGIALLKNNIQQMIDLLNVLPEDISHKMQQLNEIQDQDKRNTELSNLDKLIKQYRLIIEDFESALKLNHNDKKGNKIANSLKHFILKFDQNPQSLNNLIYLIDQNKANLKKIQANRSTIEKLQKGALISQKLEVLTADIAKNQQTAEPKQPLPVDHLDRKHFADTRPVTAVVYQQTHEQTKKHRSVYISSEVTYGEFKKFCIAAEKSFTEEMSKSTQNLYKGVSISEGFTIKKSKKINQKPYVTKVVIKSKNLEAHKAPHKMESQFIPKDPKSIKDLNTEGYIKITIDPNPDDKILYHAFSFHKAVPKLKLEVGSEPKVILNLINAANTAGWNIEVMERDHEEQWMRAPVKDQQNILGITESDYQNLLDYVSRMDMKQAASYQDILEKVKMSKVTGKQISFDSGG